MRALETLEELPPEVESWRVKVGKDWTDDDAVWVWADLADAEVDPDQREDTGDLIRVRVREAAAIHIRDPIAYVRLLAKSEEPTV